MNRALIACTMNRAHIACLPEAAYAQGPVDLQQQLVLLFKANLPELCTWLLLGRQAGVLQVSDQAVLERWACPAIWQEAALEDCDHLF